MLKRISKLALDFASDLSPRQVAIVAFISTFITVIGGLALAYYFRRRNQWRLHNQPVEKLVDLFADSAY
jgi:uncharacterized membrane protein YbhN (UPF0104 family)